VLKTLLPTSCRAWFIGEAEQVDRLIKATGGGLPALLQRLSSEHPQQGIVEGYVRKDVIYRHIGFLSKGKVKINLGGAASAGLLRCKWTSEGEFFCNAKGRSTLEAPLPIDELTRLIGSELTQLLQIQLHNQMSCSKCCAELYSRCPQIRESLKAANVTICGLVKERKFSGIQMYSDASGKLGTETFKLLTVDSGVGALSMIPDSALTGLGLECSIHEQSAAPDTEGPPGFTFNFGAATDVVSTARVNDAHALAPAVSAADVEARHGFNLSEDWLKRLKESLHSAEFHAVPFTNCYEASKERRSPRLVAGPAHVTLGAAQPLQRLSETLAENENHLERGLPSRFPGVSAVSPAPSSVDPGASEPLFKLWQEVCPRIPFEELKTKLYQEGYQTPNDLESMEGAADGEEFTHIANVILKLKPPEIRRLKLQLQWQ
jgi:hypothetical protein